MFDESFRIRGFDDELANAISAEQNRQEDHIELIASENYASPRVMEAQGSVLTNKYAEGYPGKRYYGGCEFVDQAEELARNRVKEIFGASYANVQPHSGSQANAAAYHALLDPGDTLLGMSLNEGGHLTHGSPVNFSGKLFNAVQYGINNETGLIDYDIIADLAEKAPAKDADRWFLGLFEDHRLGKNAGNSGFRRCLVPGGHGARGRPGGRRCVSQSGSACPCHHLNHPQDPAWPPGRHYPCRR